MDLLSGSSALASIVGLIGQFKSNRASDKSGDFNEFMLWLEQGNHAELQALIMANHATSISIKAILNQGKEKLTESLNRIDYALATITTTLAGFGDLSKSIHPNAILSDQLLDILKSMNDMCASQVLLVRDWEGGAELIPLDGNGDGIEIKEPRFLESDMHTAVQAGLLLYGSNSRGEPVWTFTRSAAALLDKLPI